MQDVLKKAGSTFARYSDKKMGIVPIKPPKFTLFQTKKMKNIRYSMQKRKRALFFLTHGFFDKAPISVQSHLGDRHSGGGGETEAPRCVINQYF